MAIKQKKSSYPFGGEGPAPYYYKSPELYSSIMLTYGILFVLLMLLGIWNIRKKKINGLLMLTLACTLIIIQLIHGLQWP
ncbi:hypothetical protein [Aureisphaera sp.]